MDFEYQSGTVEMYDDRAGYGYVTPDASQDASERLLVHRKSLRNNAALLQAGDRVIFRVEQVPRGKLATDVHPEEVGTIGDDGIVEPSSGRVSALFVNRNFGFINGRNEERIFFHFSQLPAPNSPPAIGTEVIFGVRQTDRGPQAEAISLGEASSEIGAADLQPAFKSTQVDFLPHAILERDGKRFDEAVKLYERGMKESPSVQLITSYAAMEKNRNRRKEAMRIYEQGLLIFPSNLKLHEDAGFLAASIGDVKTALTLLERGLELSRSVGQGSDRIFLLAIARVYAKRGLAADLQRCLEYYKLAEQAFATSRFGRASFPKEDQLYMNLAAIRLQHYRGRLAYEFIQRSGFKILRAQLLEQTTVGADLIVEIKSPELVESYGISGNLLMRCFFKSDISRGDVDELDAVIKSWGASGLIDEQVALVLVSSLTEGVERLLFSRIEDSRRSVPAIVPITQSQIETEDDPVAALRSVLDRWLYRRDLFAQNFPVSGRRFFGRDRSLAEVRDAIANGAAAGIFGLRKVGKTSLLKEVSRRATDAGDIAIYMDLLRVPADVTDTRWLYWKLGSYLFERASRLALKGIHWRIGNSYSDYFDLPADFPVATAFDSDLTQVLSALRRTNISPRPKVILMLDEIERLIPNGAGKEGFKGFFDFFSYIRGVAQESDDFVPIITGANAAIAEVAQFSGRDNPIFNFFREIYLPLLRPDESMLMIQTLGRGMGVRFPGEACERIYRLTGGHPFFTRQFCSFICERHPNRPLTVTRGMVDGLSEQYLEVASRDFSEIVERIARDYREELDACVSIARAREGLTLMELTNGGKRDVSIRHLLGYQIVSISGDSVFLTMELLKTWLDRGEGRIHD
jgi:cold shock CspA family protein